MKKWEYSATGGNVITAKQAAEKTGISPENFYYYLRTGQIKRAKPEKNGLRSQKLLFFEADIDALIAS